jgi:hypothetical protein
MGPQYGQEPEQAKQRSTYSHFPVIRQEQLIHQNDLRHYHQVRGSTTKPKSTRSVPQQRLFSRQKQTRRSNRFPAKDRSQRLMNIKPKRGHPLS